MSSSPAQATHEAARIAQVQAEVMRRIRAEEFEIPALPRVAAKVLAVSTDPTVGLTEIERLIATDQALTSKVFARVNSAAYGKSVPTTSLRSALLFMGLHPMRDFLFGVGLRDKLFSIPRYLDIVEESWTHSLRTAIASDHIARALGAKEQNAFLAGLLCEIGRPILVRSIVQAEESVLDGEPLGRFAVFSLINDLQGRAGYRAATTWSLPEEVVEVVRSHEAKEAPSSSLSLIVRCGSCLSHHLERGGEAFPTLGPHLEFAEWGLEDERRVPTLLDTVEADFQVFMGAFAT